MKIHNSKKIIFPAFLVALFVVVCYGYFEIAYQNRNFYFKKEPEVKASSKREVVHLKTPESVRGIYLTSWTAGSPQLREKLITLVDETELNTVVIDVKDYTGKISFVPNNPELGTTAAVENRIPDLDELIDFLHSKNIYVIGRIAAFQDTAMVVLHPDWAVKKKSDKNKVWRDYKGVPWIDAGSRPMWNYLILLGKETYNRGFDELNFDYIRFPSDGNMKDIYFPSSDGRPKSEVLMEFFAYLKTEFSGTGAVLSGDFFGMTTASTFDMNIGQVLEKAFPYFDYISPMVYPSHYPVGFEGFNNPAEHPYEVVKIAMDQAVSRAKNASTTPLKIRPWLQDFDLGADYTAPMVRKQIEATYDSGLTSWMMWSASNRYTVEAYKK